MNTLEQCLEGVAQGRIKETLEALSALVRHEDQDARIMMVQLSARYNRHANDRRLRLRAQGELDIELNQITYDLIEYIHSLRSDGGFTEPEPQEDYPGEKTRILFSSACPHDLEPLAVGTEYRDIRNILRAATERDRFVLHRIDATRSDDLLQEMMTFKPHFFHFSGHGSQGAIYLLDPDGASRKLSKQQLSAIFRFFSDTIGCVFLNACYSAEQAEAICAYIPYVIGTTIQIPDHIAIHFATKFYQAIWEGKDIGYAYEFAKMAVEVEGYDGEGAFRMMGGGK